MPVRILGCLKKQRLQEVKFPADATTAETVSLVRRTYEQIHDECQGRREQDVINKSMTVDFDRRITTELLPLMFNLLHKLAHNKNNTPRICNQKLNELNQNPQNKEDVIQSEDKFESLGHM